jgi:glycosyltransferase involved in cell wall biosynthesis
MRIGWIQDYSLFTQVGGAELSDRSAFVEGLKRGHDMLLVNPGVEKYFPVEAVDAVIISNATRFPTGWLQKIVSSKPTVMYIHDYWPLCSYRLYYPMLEKCKKCKNLETARALLLGSVLNIFLSPLHFDSWAFAIPEVKDHPNHLHPSPVDTEFFKPVHGVKIGDKTVKIERNPKAGLVVNAMEFKGSKNTVKYCSEHPDITFTFVGGQPQNVKFPPNCIYTGPVVYEKMPGMYAQASYYVELPDTPQPFNRTCLEARLMEVPKLIVNENIGFLSYDWSRSSLENIKQHINEAVPNWWKKVEEALK